MKGRTDMNPEDLYLKLYAQPFERFSIHLTDGTVYEIRHPESVMVGKQTAVVGVKGDPDRHYYDRMVTVSLLHIIRLEPVIRDATPGNGQS
jgi:hypothetical protein